MDYQLAQINIAKFRLPMEDPINKDFVDNLDRVNAIAESQPGFVWRLVGDGNNALDLKAYEDPNIAVNMSVWQNLESLTNFVYKNSDHLEIMRNRKKWFDKIDFYMTLWWVEEGHIPSVAEGKTRLEHLEANGPTSKAFTFKNPFSPAPEMKYVRFIHDKQNVPETDLPYFEEVLGKLRLGYSKPPELHPKGYSLFFDCSFEEVEGFIQSVTRRGFRVAL